MFLCTSQVSKIGRTLRDGTRLLWIFQTVARAEYFRGPRNSITTALHYGKCQWVFNIFFLGQLERSQPGLLAAWMDVFYILTPDLKLNL